MGSTKLGSSRIGGYVIGQQAQLVDLKVGSVPEDSPHSCQESAGPRDSDRLTARFSGPSSAIRPAIGQRG